MRADVTEPDTVQAAVDAVDGLRISICCAGIGWAERTAHKPRPARARAVRDRDPRQPDRHVQRAAARRRRDVASEPVESGERGVCINTASIAAYDGQIGQIAYSASKGGIVGMTLPAARDLASRGHPRVHDRAGPVRHAAARRPARAGRARRSAPPFPFPSRLGRPAEYAALAAHIVDERDAQRRGDPARRRAADAAEVADARGAVPRPTDPRCRPSAGRSTWRSAACWSSNPSPS